MRCSLLVCFSLLIACQPTIQQVGILPPPADYPIHPVLFTEVVLEDGFWKSRLDTNRNVSIPFALEQCEQTGRIANFAIAGGLQTGEFQGRRYDDSDVFKVMEGAAYSLQTHPNPELSAYLDTLIGYIAAAQEPDGYLFTTRTIHPAEPIDASPERWSNLKRDHELYNVGHMYEAAVAHFQATGKWDFLNIALKNADLIHQEFLLNERPGVPGHQEIEIGLMRLYRATGKKQYLDLAKLLLDRRGTEVPEEASPEELEKFSYNQNHLPILEQTEAVGHAVRAGYQYAAMADVAALSGDTSYLQAMDRIWQDVVGSKQAVTGGVGGKRKGEAFSIAYDLPNALSYNETCAAVANMMWNHRLFLLHGDGKYLDVMERTLYNGFLAGVSLEGDRFFYVNPLEADGEFAFNASETKTRAPWFGTSCCPVNVARFLPSLPGYAYAWREKEVFVNLFLASEVNIQTDQQLIHLRQETNYPWEGKITLTLTPEQADSFHLSIRLPSWTDNQAFPSDLYRFQSFTNRKLSLRVNGELIYPELKQGFARIYRKWEAGDVVELEMPLPIRKLLAHPEVAEAQGKFALSRGPLVYCVEAVDVEGSLSDFVMPRFGKLETEFRPDLLHGVQVISGTSIDGRAFQAIPYYAWSHRGEGAMKVWLPWAE